MPKEIAKDGKVWEVNLARIIIKFKPCPTFSLSAVILTPARLAHGLKF